MKHRRENKIFKEDFKIYSFDFDFFSFVNSKIIKDFWCCMNVQRCWQRNTHLKGPSIIPGTKLYFCGLSLPPRDSTLVQVLIIIALISCNEAPCTQYLFFPQFILHTNTHTHNLLEVLLIYFISLFKLLIHYLPSFLI